MAEILKDKNAPCVINYIGSLGCVFFTKMPVTDYASAKTADTKTYAEYFKHMLRAGIHLAPAQFEAMFLSDAHTDEDIEATLEAVRNFF